MKIEEIRKIIYFGTEEQKNNLRDYFKKYGNTYDKEVEVHEILVNALLELNKEERILLSSIIGYPVFLRICLMPKIRHKFPLLQDGAALILLDAENNVLVQQRMDNGKYGFSGGCQELGEELTDVAIRECYEEAGLLLDKGKIIDVCEVSGLSRRNSYPNGDVVVNNTALYIGYATDCTGNLHKDYESKEVSFKPLSFLENLPDEQKHEKDFIDVLKMYLAGNVERLKQPLIDEIELPSQGDLSFVDYLASLSPDQALVLAKKMGYMEFLNVSLDERIKDIFPHLVDKSILVAIKDNELLVTKDNTIPKTIQSVGESFEDSLSCEYGLDNDNLRLAVRLSGNNWYVDEENAFINGMIFSPIEPIMSNENLKYIGLEEAKEVLSKEDLRYLDEYFSKTKNNLNKTLK